MRIHVTKLRSLLACVSLGGAIALGIVVAGGSPRPAGASFVDQVKFRIWRGGEDIGWQMLRFQRDGGKLIVEGESDIVVKAWIVTVYTFHQTVREVWQDGRLIHFYSKTDDDGHKFEVVGRATSDGFLVANNDGRFVAPADLMPASYWHPRTPRQTRLLDPKSGRLLKVRFNPVGYERVETTGGTVMSTRYEVDGDVKVTLWYDFRQLLAQAFYHAPEDGSLIRYQRGDPPAVTDRADR